MLTATSCSSWLSNYKGWTLNIDGGQTETSIAYYFGDGNNLEEDNTGIVHKVYPVILLNRNSEITGGNGTTGDPYVLK